jgi:iodotyrosine deiodinase
LSGVQEGAPACHGSESVGVAAGRLLAAIHHADLWTLTHAPSPMAFLGRILGRAVRERPSLLGPVGSAARDARIPAAALRKKPLDEVLVFRERVGTPG